MIAAVLTYVWEFPQTEHPTIMSTQALQKPRILVAVAESKLLALIMTALSVENDLTVAMSTSDAERKLRIANGEEGEDRALSLVIIDTGEGIDGIDVARHARSASRGCPILIMVPSQDSYKGSLAPLNCNVIVKPIESIEVIVQQVDAILMSLGSQK